MATLKLGVLFVTALFLLRTMYVFLETNNLSTKKNCTFETKLSCSLCCAFKLGYAEIPTAHTCGCKFCYESGQAVHRPVFYNIYGIVFHLPPFFLMRMRVGRLALF